MCFRAWLHDVKLELLNKQNDKRIVERHFLIWKKRISLNTIATEVVKIRSFLFLYSFFKVKVGTSKFSRLPKLAEPAIFLTGVARQRDVTLWGANLLLCQLRIALSVFLFDSRSRGNFWYFHEAYRLLNERCEEPMKTALILN